MGRIRTFHVRLGERHTELAASECIHLVGDSACRFTKPNGVLLLDCP